MLHLAFNFNDPVIQLRLSGLLVCTAIIVCLGILELAPPRRRLVRVGVLATTALLIASVGYLFVRLGA